MNPFVALYNFILQAVSPLLVAIASRLKRHFYIYLALVFSLLVVIDERYFQIVANMQHNAFDLMMRYRLFPPKADDQIVIVDIDEASLAALAPEYGRWPWPRQVLGEFLDHLERQHPRAVVFDILFSDPDLYNPDSDAYFDSAIAATNNTFFPFLRLAPEYDPLSQIKPAMIPGVEPIPNKAEADATLAVVLPALPSILKTGRLGYHNIFPDADGVARAYWVYRDEYGWKIPSLPARLASELGYPVATGPRILMNWRGKPFAYRRVSFASVFNDMLSKDKQRPQNEFAGKIVLIGSTAASLFDVKATPMSELHPGVAILANAIDNLKHGDYLRYPEARVFLPLLAIALVWSTALAFYRNPSATYVDRMIGGAEFTLLAVSYASINFSNIFINLTGPVTVELAYFALARIYTGATAKALETSVYRRTVESTRVWGACLLLVRLAPSGASLNESKLSRLCERLEKTGGEAKSVEMIRGRQKGIWAMFDAMVAASWIFPAQDLAARERVHKDIERVIDELPRQALKLLGSTGAPPRWILQEGLIGGGASAGEDWENLFARAQSQWQTTHQQGAGEDTCDEFKRRQQLGS